LTYADFFLFELLDQNLALDPKCLDDDQYIILREHRSSFMALDEIQDYRSTRFKEEPIHNRYSHFHRGWLSTLSGNK